MRRQGVGADKFTHFIHTNIISVLPIIVLSVFFGALLLLSFQIKQNIFYGGQQRQSAHARLIFHFVLCNQNSLSVHFALHYGMVKRYRIIFKIDRAPTQTAYFTSPQTVYGGQLINVFVRIALQFLKEHQHLFCRIKFCFELRGLWPLHFIGGIGQDIIAPICHFQSSVQNGMAMMSLLYAFPVLLHIGIKFLNIFWFQIFQPSALFRKISGNVFDSVFIDRICSYLYIRLCDLQPFIEIIRKERTIIRGNIFLFLGFSYRTFLRLLCVCAERSVYKFCFDCPQHIHCGALVVFFV